MAACLRNMTFMSSSLTKLASKKPKCGQTQLCFVLPKRYLSGLLSNNIRCHQHQTHRHKQHLYGLLAARHASTGSANLPPGYIPDIPIAPIDDMKTVLPELNALGEPTLQSIGLAGNNPSGCVQQVLEFLHVTLDIPWWGAIALGALAIRTVMFPLMIYQRRSAIKLRNHMPTIARLQQKISDARAVGDNMEASKRTGELAEFMKRNDIKFRRMFVMPAVQIPILLSVYQGIKKMSELPVEMLKTGGISWFTDLTVADPYYILPASTALSVLLMLELGAESQSTRDMSHAVKWLMRGMPAVIFLVTCKFASGIAFYWSVNNLISLITVQILKQPKVKKTFNLPDEMVHKKEVRQKKGFVEGFSDMYVNYQLQSETNQRRRIDDMAFKKAGVGPVPKTYRYNPTKTQQKNKAAL